MNDEINLISEEFIIIKRLNHQFLLNFVKSSHKTFNSLRTKEIRQMEEQKEPEQVDIEELKRILIEHQYEYSRPIGHGAFGSVFHVHSLKYKLRDFVVKRIAINCDGGNSSNSSYENAAHEASVLIKLCQPNIISMYDFFPDENQKNLFIILEYCPGGSLQSVIDKHGRILPPKLITYTKQIIEALIYCHGHNVAHRDIKPANILIDSYERLKLADFGLSMKFDANDDKLLSFAGSRAYMAPEVVSRIPNDPFLADIWSLGITLYTMAVGTTPWPDDSTGIELAIKMGMITFPPDLDYKYAKFLRRILVTSPHKRASLKDLLKDQIFSENIIPVSGRRSSGGISSSASLIGSFDRNISFQSGPGVAAKQFATKPYTTKPKMIRGAASYYPAPQAGKSDLSLAETDNQDQFDHPNLGSPLGFNQTNSNLCSDRDSNQSDHDFDENLAPAPRHRGIKPAVSVKSFARIGNQGISNMGRRRMSHILPMAFQTFADT
ncbi:CAMK family protein kinase [Tritrichomonas foetus]|uniref:CAMK family protein kinase n=1 Tax=Tritrichomonas foetus TaxID=1144522 RepID=A0A1J4KTH5_9EUKA|nr:CAMK family protein kinase [Tritrichomonas foetus]|eukprot:OHT14567.1 CAMK family protein kinase [Tritrichomonas foetus]